jgi:hypothetical protein
MLHRSSLLSRAEMVNVGLGGATMINELLSPNDAARILGVTEAALSRFRYEHRGPVFVRIGKLVRYREADLTVWLEACSVQPGIKEGTAA